jgi:succinate dehydrogenase / fumarate reductase iron-sulfur subunit
MESAGKLVNYDARDIRQTHRSQMLDIVNESYSLGKGQSHSIPIAARAFAEPARLSTDKHTADHPGAVSNMRKFRDGATIIVEPFQVRSFSDRLVTDRSALDRIVQLGIHIWPCRLSAGSELDGFPKHDADLAMEAAACIGCGACAAAWPDGWPCSSPRRVSFIVVPQGHPERVARVLKMCA